MADNVALFQPEYMKGRRTIYTDATAITRKNVIDELTVALNTHRENRTEIQYLWNYYRGQQDILNKVKEIRSEINNKITVNKAHEIVEFKVGYLVGEPIQYISRRSEEEIMDAVGKLNDAMFTLGKSSLDKTLVEWDMICGTAYRYVAREQVDDVPFKLYTLDPRNTFVVYSSNISHEPMFAVSYYVKEGTDIVTVPTVGSNSVYSREVYEIYTKTDYYVIEEGKIKKHARHYLGAIPIIEYPANSAKQGAFEIVLPLLNALNAMYSNRLDSVEQFVQSFMKFVNCSFEEGDLEKMKEYGAIMIKSENNLPADVELVSQEMDQTQTQTLVNSIEQAIISICGLPVRNGGMSSTSDTGRAVELRDGYVTAEYCAKESERSFREGEVQTLRIIFKICDVKNMFSLKIQDVDMQFTRRNYDNIQSKAQVLIALLQNPKVHPKLAYTASGLFTDPESAYQMSMEYYEEYMKQEQEQQMAIASASNKALENNEQGSSKNAKTESKPISNPIQKAATETQH